jgi:hypothetical protein
MFKLFRTEALPAGEAAPRPEGWRLTRWPELPDSERTAPVLRALSIMSTRAVTAHWLVMRTGWPPERIVVFLARLERDQCACRLHWTGTDEEEVPALAERRLRREPGFRRTGT